MLLLLHVLLLHRMFCLHCLYSCLILVCIIYRISQRATAIFALVLLCLFPVFMIAAACIYGFGVIKISVILSGAIIPVAAVIWLTKKADKGEQKDASEERFSCK